MLDRLPSHLLYDILAMVAMPYSHELHTLFRVEEIYLGWHHNQIEFSPHRILRRMNQEHGFSRWIINAATTRRKIIFV